jgi:hypothetical protein
VDDTTIAESRRLLDVCGYERLQTAVVEARPLGRRPASAAEHVDDYLTTALAQKRQEADQLRQDAAAGTATAAIAMVKRGYSTRDIGTAQGVTAARVSR